MSVRYFIDTNIFVYTFDYSDTKKQLLSQELVSRALSSGEGVISVQVIHEFLNVAVSKFKKPLTVQDSKEYLSKVLIPLCEIYSDAVLFELGLDIHATTNYSFYDSMILAAANKGRCKILYSEDINHNSKVFDVTIINPFK